MKKASRNTFVDKSNLKFIFFSFSGADEFKLIADYFPNPLRRGIWEGLITNI